ncbi:MAG: PKD domain-containing protein [Bacteroidota bacterium]|jgi:hypothetical protein
MITKIKLFGIVCMIGLIAFIGCKKTDYSFGDIKTPTGLTLTALVVGTDATNLYGDGSGQVNITTNATGSLTYKIDFGDGTNQMVPSGTISYKYHTPGTNDYTVTVTAIGTGGSESVISKKITVLTNFTIPADIVTDLTNGSSQVWQTDHDAVGHVGVGPTTSFSSDWYSATPNTRDACLYDDEITFTKDSKGNISMSVDNKGQTFIIAAATSFYSQSGGDNCYSITTTPKQLSFMDATSASTSANSTRIQFTVPGNGIINFATGGTTYEILSITPTTMTLRNIGVDGNAWYQKLKVK